MSKRKKFDTNEEFVRRLMNGGPAGPLTQLFVIDALDKWSKTVSEAPVEKLDSPLINGAAWKATAKYVQDEIQKMYNENMRA